jgi:predicted amidophosphoribosyltransferase
VLAVTKTVEDCPECRSAGSVLRGNCEICFAELDEHVTRSPERSTALRTPAHELRFDDVIGELEKASRLASRAREQELAPDLAAACRKVAALLTSLRDQFRRDLGLRAPERRSDERLGRV